MKKSIFYLILILKTSLLYSQNNLQSWEIIKPNWSGSFEIGFSKVSFDNKLLINDSLNPIGNASNFSLKMNISYKDFFLSINHTKLNNNNLKYGIEPSHRYPYSDTLHILSFYDWYISIGFEYHLINYRFFPFFSVDLGYIYLNEYKEYDCYTNYNPLMSSINYDISSSDVEISNSYHIGTSFGVLYLPFSNNESGLKGLSFRLFMQFNKYFSYSQWNNKQITFCIGYRFF